MASANWEVKATLDFGGRSWLCATIADSNGVSYEDACGTGSQVCNTVQERLEVGPNAENVERAAVCGPVLANFVQAAALQLSNPTLVDTDDTD